MVFYTFTWLLFDQAHIYIVGWTSVKLATTLRKTVSSLMALAFFGPELGMLSNNLLLHSIDI